MSEEDIKSLFIELPCYVAIDTILSRRLKRATNYLLFTLSRCTIIMTLCGDNKFISHSQAYH